MPRARLAAVGELDAGGFRGTRNWGGHFIGARRGWSMLGTLCCSAHPPFRGRPLWAPGDFAAPSENRIGSAGGTYPRIEGCAFHGARYSTPVSAGALPGQWMVLRTYPRAEPEIRMVGRVRFDGGFPASVAPRTVPSVPISVRRSALSHHVGGDPPRNACFVRFKMITLQTQARM
jgi:hypothetical protein